MTNERTALIGPGDCVLSLNRDYNYYFVVARQGDELTAILLATGEGGRFRPTQKRVSLDANSVVLIIGKPNEWSVKLTEADYERLTNGPTID